MSSNTQTFRLDAGAIEYTWPVTVTTDKDITADTSQVGLGSFFTPPAVWYAPDRVSNPNADAVQLQLLIGATVSPAAGAYWLWWRITDSPQVIARRSPLRIRVYA